MPCFPECGICGIQNPPLLTPNTCSLSDLKLTLNFDLDLYRWPSVPYTFGTMSTLLVWSATMPAPLFRSCSRPCIEAKNTGTSKNYKKTLDNNFVLWLMWNIKGLILLSCLLKFLPLHFLLNPWKYKKKWNPILCFPVSWKGKWHFKKRFWK